MKKERSRKKDSVSVSSSLSTFTIYVLRRGVAFLIGI